MMTSYEKLKSLPYAASYLKSGITFQALDEAALEMTDLESATALMKAQNKLFQTIFK